jgi:lysophospholipase L1-like esterase
MVDSKNGLQESYTYDGIHPNAMGYKIMGPLAKAAIQKALH